LTDPIRAVVREVNSGLAIFNVRTMEQVVADSLWELHLYRWLIGCFAGLALVLAAIGLYGVISYSATSRIREFAVRLALGAEPAGVSGLVLGRAMRLAGAGVCTGVAMALAVTVFVWNPELPVGTALYVLVAFLVMAIALAACLVPAIRVSRLDPATALRHE
jgi:ABC-type antimicrobial peptide transport system permease subunit